jgi:DNA-binding MarR family transcriptional regulator
VSAVDREANVLGALATIVNDLTADAIATAAGQGGTAAAALSALHHFLDRPTVDTLRRVLGLTPSGAVRLVDRLAEAGYVTRGPGEDGRSRAVLLTRKGRQAAARVSAARAQILNEALHDLTPEERDTLHALAGRVVATLVHRKLTNGKAADRGWTCRLCDVVACGRDEGDCPTANAARAVLGP